MKTETNTVQHTLLQFEAIINHARYANYSRSLIVANGKQIANCYIPKEESNVSKSEAEANAAFIVTACNNYYPMLEALKEIVNNCFTFENGMKHVPNEFIAAAKKVIKAAEQENQ